MGIVTLDVLRQDPEVAGLISAADNNLGVIGYTEHGDRHLSVVSERASSLLATLGKDKRTAELAAIAAVLHDIGNVVNRRNHAVLGALLAKPILVRLGMPFDEINIVIAAIGNHHEGEGEPVSDVSAALILADKSDVHETRVRASGNIVEDIHDRVNFAAKDSNLFVGDDGKTIVVEILIDPSASSVMEYFEIFLLRMKACKVAAEFLGATFQLVVNGVKLT